MPRVIESSLADCDLIRAACSARISRWSIGRGWPDGKPLKKVYKRPASGLRAELWSDQSGLCFYCRKPMRLVPPSSPDRIPPDAATIDHVVPRSHGGSNNRENLVMACHACNQEKADRLPGEFPR